MIWGMAASISKEASIFAFIISTLEDILSWGKNSNGFILKGATLSSPSVNISKSSISFSIALYSVFAGSITKNGKLADFKILWQVVVLPLPVTPAINICLSSQALSIKIFWFNSLPLWTILPKNIALSCDICSLIFRPNSTSSFRDSPTTSFFGKVAITLSSLADIQHDWLAKFWDSRLLDITAFVFSIKFILGIWKFFIHFISFISFAAFKLLKMSGDLLLSSPENIALIAFPSFVKFPFSFDIRYMQESKRPLFLP